MIYFFPMMRISINIVILLLLGAILNVAVAWGCAIRWVYDPFGEIRFGSTYDESTKIVWKVDGKHWIGTSEISIDGWYYELEDYVEDELTVEEATPFWLDWERPEDISDSRELYNADIIAHGLPFRSLLVFDDNESNDSDSVFKKGIEATFPDWIRGSEPEFGFRLDTTHLPLKPTWLGFLANTIIYSWFFLLGQLQIKSVRKRRRRKRGLCIKCAYDLRGTEHAVCPECGSKNN